MKRADSHLNNVRKKLFPVLILISLFVSACADKNDTVHFSFAPRTWYQDKMGADAIVSPDGKKIAITSEYTVSVYNITSGEMSELSENLNIEWAWAAHWGDNGNIIAFQSVTDDKFSPVAYDLAGNEKTDPKGRILNPVRANSKSDDVIVYNGSQGIWVKDSRKGKTELAVPDVRSLAVALAPDKNEFAYLLHDEPGYMTLIVYDLELKTARTVHDNLDATYQRQRICYSPDGNHILVSLASDSPPPLETKHIPETDRNLKIFAINKSTGDLKCFVDDPGDNHIAGTIENRLVWRNFTTSMKTGIIPSGGGEIKLLSDKQTALAYWHPGGSRISVMYGDWHLADWALNWDIGVIDVNGNGEPSGELKNEITGFQEDYALVWSPDGKWQAYHSHRSQTPVTHINAAGSTDDIWLKQTGSNRETRLTDFGAETTAPDWAPDSKRLVFCSIGENGYKPWMVSIDESGNAASKHEIIVDEIKGSVTHASWSPVRSEFALEETTGKRGRRIWLINEDGSNPRMLVDYESVPELGGTDFTPDGNKILYSALVDGHQQIFEIDRNGENRKQLTFEQQEVIWPQVSPDGKWISCTVYKHTNTIKEISLEGLLK